MMGRARGRRIGVRHFLPRIRQVVDVTGSEWTPNICYAGNAMLRRSRRIQSKEQIIGDITAEQNTGKVGNDGTSSVPQITGKRPTDTGTADTGNVLLPLPSTGTSTGKVPANTSTGSVPLNTTRTDNGTEAISIPTEAPEPITPHSAGRHLCMTLIKLT